MCAAQTLKHRDGSPMVLIPEGPFLMGSNEGEPYERPFREVHLDAFYVDCYSITNAQYAQFVKDTGYQIQGRWPEGYQRIWGDQHPAVYLTWFDAKAYAQWAGKRLASEAEWEKAARGVDGRRYPWGNRWDPQKCWCWEAGARGPAPVGSCAGDVSPFGVHDMAGNVTDWLEDWVLASSYEAWPSRNPRGPTMSTDRACRGGNWFSNDRGEFTCFCRGAQNPVSNQQTLGFRCILEVRA
jgi:formylglycine-generating enzyme required for sulfatase activity